MPHIFPFTLLDVIIILSIIGGLFSFATWGLKGDDEVEEEVDTVPEPKITCDIEDYDELQRRINKLKIELEDFERPDLAPCEYEPPDEEDDDDEGGLVVRK